MLVLLLLLVVVLVFDELPCSCCSSLVRVLLSFAARDWLPCTYASYFWQSAATCEWCKGACKAALEQPSEQQLTAALIVHVQQQQLACHGECISEFDCN
jgi:hypothetical protein